jgi:hypothetical protein
MVRSFVEGRHPKWRDWGDNNDESTKSKMKSVLR